MGCCSNGNGSFSPCCPPAQIFEQEICGNFNGPGTVGVFNAPAGDYIQGTFELFNSAASTGNVVASVAGGTGTGNLDVPPGFTASRTVENPTVFTIDAGEGESGTYCITLYKRVLA